MVCACMSFTGDLLGVVSTSIAFPKSERRFYCEASSAVVVDAVLSNATPEVLRDICVSMRAMCRAVLYSRLRRTMLLAFPLTCGSSGLSAVV